MWMMRESLEENKPEMFPSFFQTLESPSVPEYKAGQRRALEKNLDSPRGLPSTTEDKIAHRKELQKNLETLSSEIHERLTNLSEVNDITNNEVGNI